MTTTLIGKTQHLRSMMVVSARVSASDIIMALTKLRLRIPMDDADLADIETIAGEFADDFASQADHIIATGRIVPRPTMFEPVVVLIYGILRSTKDIHDPDAAADRLRSIAWALQSAGAGESGSDAMIDEALAAALAAFDVLGLEAESAQLIRYGVHRTWAATFRTTP